MEKIGQVNNYAGTIISLNQKNGSYIGIGPIATESKGPSSQYKVWLTPKEWHTAVPEGLTADETMQLEHAIKSGLVVIGKHYLPAAVKNPAVVQKYIKLMKESPMLDAKAKKPFINLVNAKSEGFYTALEILSACIKEEESTRRRETWITFLKDGLRSYNGPEMLVQDYSDDPGNYTVTIDPQSLTIVEDSRGDKKPKEPEKPKSKLSAKQKEEALKKFLGD